MTEARQRAVHQPRIRSAHRFRAHTKTVHDAWTEILDHHVGSSHKAAGDIVISRVVEVKNDVPLTALQHRIDRMVPARAAGRVHSHDIGAGVGQPYRD